MGEFEADEQGEVMALPKTMFLRKSPLGSFSKVDLAAAKGYRPVAPSELISSMASSNYFLPSRKFTASRMAGKRRS